MDFTEIAYAGIDSLTDNPLLYRLRARYRRREIRWLLTSHFPYLEDDSVRILPSSTPNAVSGLGESG